MRLTYEPASEPRQMFRAHPCQESRGTPKDYLVVGDLRIQGICLETRQNWMFRALCRRGRTVLAPWWTRPALSCSETPFADNTKCWCHLCVCSFPVPSHWVRHSRLRALSPSPFFFFFFTLVIFFFFFTLVTGPRRSLSLKLSDTRVYKPQIRARLGTTAHF